MAPRMSSVTPTRLARWLLLATGVGDVGAGLALAFAPAAALAMAGLAAPGDEALVYLRWVGVFAGAVGVLYLRGGSGARVREVLGSTLIFRAPVGVFVTVAVLRGWLAPVWAGVALINVGLVVVQAGLLAKGAGRDE